MLLRIVLQWRRSWILRICIKMVTIQHLLRRCKRKAIYWMNIPSLPSQHSSTSIRTRAGTAIEKAQRRISLKPLTSKISTILPSNKRERRRWRSLLKTSRKCEDQFMNQMENTFPKTEIRGKAYLNNPWWILTISEASILKTRIWLSSFALRARRNSNLTLKIGNFIV